MSKYLIDSDTLTDIADAIREQTGESGSIQVSQMASQIEAIQGGSADYSTTEHEVGTWINGETLYEISIAITTGTSSPTKYDVPTGLDKIVDMRGIAWVHGTDTASLGYYVSATDRFVAYYSPSQGKIVVAETAWGNDTTGYITIRYTKTSANREIEPTQEEEGINEEVQEDESR